ncbi:MAG: oxidoreductase C-terminal domain-containing protein [Tetrasphaera sp.]
MWADQYGHRIQVLGRPLLGKPAILRGEASAGNLFAAYGDVAGKLVAAVIVDNPRLMLMCRKAILAGKSVADLASQLT